MIKFNNKKGTTLIELVMIIVILAIIAVTVTGVIIFFVQLFVYSPRQLDSQKIGGELTNIMIEGTADCRGIRYAIASKVLDASSTQFSYTYGYPIAYDSSVTPTDQLSVRFRWNAADKHIYRSTSTNGGSSWSTETVIPYYIPSTILIDGKDTPSVIFTYKKVNDANWVSGTDVVTAIRRVIISINLKTGSGSFAAFQGSANITSSVEIKSF
jgi:hypothetical protein